MQTLTPRAIGHIGISLGIFLFLFSFVQGFYKSYHPEVVVIEGMMASLFWLLSAALPFYFKAARSYPDLSSILNAVAAGCTGGALMASVPKAWLTVAAAL
jgi:vacuolar-type H+-ATPase subunit I/STV1